jgi:hypothetical protein
MYSSSEESCQKAFDNALLLALKSFGNFLKYLQQCFARKIDWCFANRKSVINRSHNTNNLAETNFRLIKDIILGRLKAPNAVSLLSFICFEFDDYYCRRLTDVAFGRGQNKNNLYKVVCNKAIQLIDKFKVAFEKVEDDVYSAPSADGKTLYMVHTALGTCTCVQGCQGKFCKHQCAVGILFEREFLNSPILSANDKCDMYYVANASRISRNFFAPLRAVAPENEPQSDQENDENICPSNDESLSPSDWSDCDEPLSKRARLDNDFDVSQVLQKLNEFCENAKDIISKSATDSYLLKHAHNFAAYANKFETGTQLASFFATALERHKRGGKIIPVQPMNVNRRKSSSRSRRVLRCGRPLQGVKVAVKRKRGLSQNIAQNQRNAKSHGNAH